MATSLILAASLMCVSGAEHPVANPAWRAQVGKGTPHLDLGFQAGRHLGFFVRGDWNFWSWGHGEFGIGGLFATHFYFLRDPRRPQQGIPIKGADTSVNLAPTLGHTFRFAKRRLSLRNCTG